MEHAEALAVLEALLFVADEPLSPDQLSGIFGDRDGDDVRTMVQVLNGRYGSEGSALQIEEVAGGFRLGTRPDLAPWVQRLNRVRPGRLSRAALETLAVIAYRQPLTKAEIEGVRGVSADGVLRTLLERELIRIVGRKPEAGRPILYGTTRTFLEHFGFKDLTDLPTLREIEELLAEGEARRAAEPADALTPAGGEGEHEGGEGPGNETAPVPSPASERGPRGA
ncbi:MAG TPA: SMC-Scp complex subunit ScpB [Candidatus Methylomirabilis sp.]|jgi:segregation and condensation protein B